MAFLNNEKGKIYCLVRPKNNVIASERLKNTLNLKYIINKTKVQQQIVGVLLQFSRTATTIRVQ